MLFGVCWNEDYLDLEFDINWFGCIFVFGGFLNEFVVILENQCLVGIYNFYNLIDIQVFGMLLVNIIG